MYSQFMMHRQKNMKLYNQSYTIGNTTYD